MVVLRHADGDVGFPELAHIQVAAVLYAPVRMVDQPFGIVPARLYDGRPEGFQREEGAEREGKATSLLSNGNNSRSPDAGSSIPRPCRCRLCRLPTDGLPHQGRSPLPRFSICGNGGWSWWYADGGKAFRAACDSQEFQEGIPARHPSTPEQVAQHQPPMPELTERIPAMALRMRDSRRRSSSPSDFCW